MADKNKTKQIKSQSPTPPLLGEFKELATVGRVQRASVRECSLFRFLVKVRRRGISTLLLKSDTRNHAPPRGRKVKVVVKWRDGGGARNDSNWTGQCTLTIELQHLHPPPFPPPLLYRITLHRHTHTPARPPPPPTHTHNSSICTPSLSPSLPHHFTQTHTHTVNTHTHTLTLSLKHTTHSGIFTPSHCKSLSVCLSVCLSLSHTHTHREKIFLIFHLTHTRARTAVSVASSEHAKNSMTRNSPTSTPSPFPLVPLQPTDLHV